MRNSCKKIAALLLALAVITSGLILPEKAFAEYADDGYSFLLDSAGDTIVKLPNLISSGAGVAGVTLTNGWHIAASEGNLYSFVVTNNGSYSGQIGYCLAPGTLVPNANAYKVKSASYVSEVAAQNTLLSESQLSYLMSLVLGYGYNGKYDKDYQNDKNYYDMFGKIWATQVLVWECVVGERGPSFNYVQPAGTGVCKDCIKSTNPIYSYFTSHYAAIEAEVQKVFKNPSFATETETKAAANTHKLAYSNGQYTLTLTDANTVLSNYTAVSSDANVSVTVNGNTITLTSAKPIASDVKITLTRNIEHKSFVIAGKNGQDFATVKKNGSGVWQSIMIPISGAATKNAYLYLEPSPAEVALTKVSANPTCTNGNPNYSLAGAVYGVYAEGDTTRNTVNTASLIGKITTDANGKGSLVMGLTAGRTVFVKEISPSKGYTVDSKVYAVIPEGTGAKAATITSVEKPVNDPITIRISKESSEKIENEASLAGTQFTIKYYAVDVSKSYTATQLTSMDATRTWIIEAKAENYSGKIIYQAGLSEKYLVPNSDPLYVVEGMTTIPVGYFTIQETKSAPGYIKDSGTIKVGGQVVANGGEAIVGWVDENGEINPISLKVSNEFIASNAPVKGGFKVGKFDAETQKAVTGSETSFALYNRSGFSVKVGGTEYANNALIANLKTTNGVYTSAANYLPYGSYELKETAAPAQYTMSGRTSVTFKIETNGTVVDLNSYAKGFTDTVIKGGFKIGKYDAETQKAITTAETSFSLYNRSGKTVIVGGKEYANNALIASLTTTKGVYTSAADYLPYGSYELVETKAPAQYTMNGRTSVTFKIEASGTVVDLNSYAKGFTDTVIKGGFKVGKFDAETQEAITEYETSFSLYNRSGKAVVVGGEEYANNAVITTLTTTKGVYESAANYLPYGRYEIEETKSPVGYLLSGRTNITFDIEEDGKIIDLNSYAKGLTDKPANGTVKVIKLAEDNVIEGIVFHLYGTSILGEEVDMTAATGADGVAVFENVPICGEEPYILEEVDTPYRYKIVEAQNVEVVAGETAEFAFVNELKKGQIEVFKIGEVFTSVTEEGGNYRAVFEEGKLKNAVFEIRAAEDIVLADGTVTYKQGDVVETITTGEDGIAKSKELDFGKYELEEVQAPAGFVRETEIFEIELTPADTDVSIATKSISNARQKIDLSILKAMEEDDTFKLGSNGELLNVKFALYAAEELIANDGSMIPKDGLLEEVSVSEDGTAAFSADLPLGKYYVKEAATDEHYILTKDTFEFTFAPGDQSIDTIEIVLNNGEEVVNKLLRGKVSGMKKDDLGNVLAGAEFGLFKEGEDAPVLTAASSEDGTFEFTDIPFGKYFVKETKAPDGYLLDENEYPIEIGEDEALIEIEIVDTLIRGSVKGKKLTDDGDELAGAEFGIFKEGADTPLLTTVSDEHGSFAFNDLPYGRYIVKELKAPEGYLLCEKEFSITIEEDEAIIEIEAVNKLIRGNLKLIKVDAENPDIRLSGAVFAVYKDANEDKALDENDEYIGSLQETEEGTYTMEGLPYGMYLVKEAKAPLYFKADGNTYSAVIENDGETVIVANTQDGLFENEYLIGIMELMPPEIDRSFHGGAEISPLTGGNMNMYVLFAAGLLGIIAALFAGKNLRKSLSFVLVLCIAFGAATPCFAAAEELKTVEVTIESYKKDDRDAVKAALEELGCKDFEIKEIKFETVSETVGVVKTEVIKGLSSKEAAKEYLEKDGLAADFEEIEFTEKYRTPAAGYYDTAADEDVPKTRTVPIRQNGESFNVKLYLQSSEDMEATEIRDASYTAYFRGNGIRKYAFGDKIVDLDGNTPCFPGYEALIMEYFGLDPEKDTITGGSWGEAGEDYKTAVYTGTSEVVVPFVRSYYAEDENNPDRPHPVSYDAEIRYTNGVEEGKTKYTLKGTVTYINYPGTGTAVKIAQKEGFFTGKRLIILTVILALLGIFFTIGRKKEQK